MKIFLFIFSASLLFYWSVGFSPINSEKLRVTAHLAKVEKLLSQRNVDHLQPQQRQNRKHMLQLLHEYGTAGRFPKNEKFAGERRPCFIDSHGNICAVGYLIQNTLGQTVAQQINAKHQYDYIADMHEPLLEKWASEQGLTLEECAMIQPQYDFSPAEVLEQPIKTGYGVASGILGGVNLALTATTISNPRSSKNFTYIGLITGTAQIIYGAAHVRQPRPGATCVNCSPVQIAYSARNNLSYINIATGVASLLTSTINLAVNKRPRARSAINLYSYPGINNRMNVGVAVTRRI
jgi:hypothetical protein